MSHLPKRLALSLGDPAGIGIDLILQLSQQMHCGHWLVFADPDVILARAKLLGLDIQLNVDPNHIKPPLTLTSPQTGCLAVVPVHCPQPKVIAGQLNPQHAPYVVEALRQACQACMDGVCDALVTGPVHKGVINQAGIPFSGHTEFLAEQTGTKQVVMMLATPDLRVALVTTHLPLRAVADAITKEKLNDVIQILHQGLKTQFKLAKPHIVVCGLNPHAGEDGHLGAEEQNIINPVLDKLRAQGLHITGAMPADTAFTRDNLTRVDAVLSMYHDQGLPVLKHQGFGRAINITLGLPIVRVSVDHGTALHLAGTGKANTGSLEYALALAEQLG